MPHGGDVRAQGAAAEIVAPGANRFRGETSDMRQETGQDALAVALADGPEPHRGRDEIGDEREYESLQRSFKRKAVPGGGEGDGDRVGDGLALCGDEIETRDRPRAAHGGEKRAALRDGFEPPLRRAGKGDGELVQLRDLLRVIG